MRKNFMSTNRKFLSLFLVMAILLSLCIGDSALAFISEFGSTKIYYNEEREIAKGVTLDNWQGRNPDGTPKLGHTITFNTKTSDALPVAAYGNVNGRETLSSLSHQIDEQGYSIIGGINGDFYYLETGVPIGIVIHDGRLISHCTTKWNAIGFKEDGSVVIGNPEIEMTAEVNGKELPPFGNFNKTQGDWGPYLYDSNFGYSTASTVPSMEVILEINEGEPKMGGETVATVKEIKKNVKSTPIGKNQLILSARTGKAGEYTLNQFKVGDAVTFRFKDKTGQWSDVKEAVGGQTVLINNGTIANGLAPRNFNPTTAIGVKANGEVILYQCDGRDDSSQGVSSLEVAQFLYNMGCVKAIQLDGGGSSAIIARMPGYESPGLINNPSDGRERANANGLILVSKQSVKIKDGEADYSHEADKIHIYPGKAYALSNATIEYSALATDDYFFPTDLPEDMVWGSSAGTFDSKGTLTINAKPGDYDVLAGSGYAIGTSQLTVLSSVTSLKPSRSAVSVQPGASVDLSCSAYYNMIKVAADDSAFTWKVEGNIGTITPDGVFTAANGAQGKGRIVVSYGNALAYIDVTFSDTPESIEDFENGTNWGSTTERAKSAKAAVIKDAKLAKSGSGLLKIDYDFTPGAGVATGTAGAYAFRIDPNTKARVPVALDNDTTAIGMWVYGDKSNTWLRAQLEDRNGRSFYIDFTADYKPDTKSGGVDWSGWKYVEASIPEGREGPFTLTMPIRIMCTRDEMRTKGTMYFDQIRAVYGVSSKDVQAPEAGIVSPANGSVINANKTALDVQLSDNISGVDTKSIHVTLDGAAVPDPAISAGKTVTIKGELGTAAPLADGMHKLVISYADLFGNAGTSSSIFRIQTGAPEITASTSSGVKEGGTFTTNISVKNPKNLKKVYLDFRYEPSKAELVDADPKTVGKQPALEGWVKKGKVRSLVDEANGKVLIEVDNLSNLAAGELAKLATITFKAKSGLQDYTKVRLELGAMLVSSGGGSRRFHIPDMQVNLEYDYKLQVTGTLPGEATTFTVTDSSGNPVAGAGIHLNNGSSAMFMTDSQGQAKTTVLTQLPEGSEVSVRAIKGNLRSNSVTFRIGKSTGEPDKTAGAGEKETADNEPANPPGNQTGYPSGALAGNTAGAGKVTGVLNPRNISISLTPDEGSMAINYLTQTDRAGTIVQYAEEGTFNGSFLSAATVNGKDELTSLVDAGETISVRVHSAILTDMKPGTAYVYRLGDKRGGYSPVYKLNTPDYDEPYSFVFVTDPQAYNAATYGVFGDVLKKASAAGPEFILIGGDMADRGGNKDLWDMFFDAGSQVFSSIPVMACPGNHEYYDDENLVNYRAMFNLPANGPADFSETAYSFETKDAVFMVLDTQRNTQKDMAKQLEWLEKVSAASSGKWKIVLMHRGLYSGFYDEAALRKTIVPVFDRAGIDLVLNGHDHTYLRTTMKGGMKVEPGKGTTYITGGSSAKKYYDAENRAWTEVLYDVNNPVFTTFKVYPDKISIISSHIENGKIANHDSFEIRK